MKKTLLLLMLATSAFAEANAAQEEVDRSKYGFFYGTDVFHEYSTQGTFSTFTMPGAKVSTTSSPSEITGFSGGVVLNDYPITFTYAQSGLMNMFPVARSLVGLAHGRPLRVMGVAFGPGDALGSCMQEFVEYRTFPSAVATANGKPMPFNAFDIRGGMRIRIADSIFGLEFGLPMHAYSVPSYLLVDTRGNGTARLGPFLGKHLSIGYHIGKPAIRNFDKKFYGTYNVGYSYLMGRMMGGVVDTSASYFVGRGGYDGEHELNVGYEVGTVLNLKYFKFIALVSVQKYMTLLTMNTDVVAMKDRTEYNNWYDASKGSGECPVTLYKARYSNNPMGTTVTVRFETRF